MSKQITVIETKLREGRTLLARDNVELRRLYEDVEAQQQAHPAPDVPRRSCSWTSCRPARRRTTEPLERDRIQAAVHDVAMRLQDLHVMQEVHLQYFVSIELTRQNNNRLGQAVDRTLTPGDQRGDGRARHPGGAGSPAKRAGGDGADAGVPGRDDRQNAAAIRRQTEEIGDLYNEPVIAMDKLVQAHHDLLAALDAATRLRDDGHQHGPQEHRRAHRPHPRAVGLTFTVSKMTRQASPVKRLGIVVGVLAVALVGALVAREAVADDSRSVGRRPLGEQPSDARRAPADMAEEFNDADHETASGQADRDRGRVVRLVRPGR